LVAEVEEVHDLVEAGVLVDLKLLQDYLSLLVPPIQLQLEAVEPQV